MAPGSRKVLNSPKVKRPLAFSSQAVCVSGSGRLIFTSGFTSRDHETGAVMHPGDIRAQTRQTLENLKLVLAEDGATLDDVVKVTVFISKLADFAGLQEARREYFPNDPPASSAIVVSSLADERLLVEIEAVAFVAG